MTDQNDDYEITDPNPGATILSFRAFGYDVAAAVADLVDNSISAKAHEIRVHFHWDGDNSYAYVLDDGKGMSEKELKEAMRPGTFNPEKTRDITDLGRFGLGLKTASFSQCKVLTVSSTNTSAPPISRNWNLDYVNQHNEWRLLKGPGILAERVLSKLKSKHPKPGTIVVWECMDRLIANQNADDEKAHLGFLKTIDRIEKHLAMVFHRFMSGSKAVKIYLNSQDPITPWDPFLIGEDATQEVGEDVLFLKGHSIRVTPYILPHYSKIPDAQYKEAEGPRGWPDMQGFYVYRNKRLLVAGDWLGLGYKKEGHYSLARIKIDLPNTLDHEWQIDVKKCTVIPHPQVHASLKRIAQLTRNRASEICRHRGKVLLRESSSNRDTVWQTKIRRGKQFFYINREHPIVAKALKQPAKETVASLLRLVEEMIPAEYIQQMQSEKQDSISPPFESASNPELIYLLEDLYKAHRGNGKNHKDAMSQLVCTEPFERYPEVISAFEEKIKKQKP